MSCEDPGIEEEPVEATAVTGRVNDLLMPLRPPGELGVVTGATLRIPSESHNQASHVTPLGRRTPRSALEWC